MQKAHRLPARRRESFELALLFRAQAISRTLDLAEEPVREVPGIHQEVWRLSATMFRPVGENRSHLRREQLLDDLLFPLMLGELVFGDEREVTRRVVEQNRSEPLEIVRAELRLRLD